MSNDNHSATMSFDRMRSMLMRAAEIRDSEQQQVFDALDEIHARLAPLESLGSVRKRLSEMPDRTEVSTLAERLDETLAKLDTQEAAITGLARVVESIVDKLAAPFAELGGRLDGMAGRFEGVAGRMDGLEDRIAGLHKRIDDLAHHLDKQDARLDGLPAAVHGPVRERIDTAATGLRGRLDEVDEGMHEHLDGVQRSIGEATGKLVSGLGETRDSLSGELDTQAGRIDPHTKLAALAGALDTVTGVLSTLSTRLDTLEQGVGGRISAVTEHLAALDGALAQRPDADSLVNLVREANEESEVRHAGQLDEAMATFAEIIMGAAPAPLNSTPPPPPRPAQRRVRKPPTTKSREHDMSAEEAAAS
ncbi:MAG: PA containing protein [Pseudonocardiaceae bacterium]